MGSVPFASVGKKIIAINHSKLIELSSKCDWMSIFWENHSINCCWFETGKKVLGNVTAVVCCWGVENSSKKDMFSYKCNFVF